VKSRSINLGENKTIKKKLLTKLEAKKAVTKKVAEKTEGGTKNCTVVNGGVGAAACIVSQSGLEALPGSPQRAAARAETVLL
jgi:hypothetical protein